MLEALYNIQIPLSEIPGPTIASAPDLKPWSPPESEVQIVASVIYGEAGGCAEEEQRLVAWCICNRVDSGIWGSSIEEVVTVDQFHGFNPNANVPENITRVAQDVLTDWYSGKEADICEPYATTSDYLFFSGDSAQQHNWYREVY